MPEERYPTQEEFWRRLDQRHVEPDLQQILRERAARTEGIVGRLGNQFTIIAVIERILPGSAVPAMVIAQFLDQYFDDPMGRADERTGIMPRVALFPAGFSQLDIAADGSFAALDSQAQDELLTQAEKGELEGPPDFDAAVWFKRMR